MTTPTFASHDATLDPRVEVETPEQVVFEYSVAGVGSRSVAAFIDSLLCVVLLILVLMFLAVVTRGSAALFGAGVSAGWAVAAIVFAQFAVQWGYYVLFEGISDGQTPGKRLMRLRVVQDGGYSISFAASAVRNLVRILDMQPGGVYAVGIAAALFSKSSKRLGDQVAGTLTVRERLVHLPTKTTSKGAERPVAVTAAITDAEYALLERYLARRESLQPSQAFNFLRQLTDRFGDRRPGSGETDSRRLEMLFAQERELRARGIAARSDTGAAREQHAIVAAGSEKWSAFATTLSDAQRRGLRNLSESEVVAFTASYRELSTDLARLRTAARGRDSESVFYLSRLVSGAHSLLYRQRRLDPKLVFRFLTVTVPLEVRRSARPILLAALLLFGPAVVTHVVVERNPALAVEFLPSGMLERARTAAQREVDGGGYLPFNVERGAPILASAVATNNLQVAFLSFAWGITAGIGTILVLLLNGVQLGGALGLYASNDMLHQIMAFVLPHGVLELTAICIAGGAGLLVGSAFVIPGAMTRREALVVRGRRSIRLVMAAVVFLAVAGPIEGFISPRNLSLPLALTVGIVTGLLGLIYIFAPAADEEMIEDEHGYRNIQSS